MGIAMRVLVEVDGLKFLGDLLGEDSRYRYRSRVRVSPVVFEQVTQTILREFDTHGMLGIYVRELGSRYVSEITPRIERLRLEIGVFYIPSRYITRISPLEELIMGIDYES